MQRFSLDSRAYGAQFASFERELIFERKHASWVEYVGKHRLRLRKSPFSEHYAPHQHFAPPDLDMYHFVENCRRIELNLKRPIDPKELMYRLTMNWRGAEHDSLGQSMALQLLSCPQDVYGAGGIGTSC